MTERPTLQARILDSRLYGIIDAQQEDGLPYDERELINRCEALRPSTQPERASSDELLADSDFVSTLLLEAELSEVRDQNRAKTRDLSNCKKLLLNVKTEQIQELTDTICTLHEAFLSTKHRTDDDMGTAAAPALHECLTSCDSLPTSEDLHSVTRNILTFLLTYRKIIISHDIAAYSQDGPTAHTMARQVIDALRTIADDIDPMTDHEDIRDWPHAMQLLTTIRNEARYFADLYEREATAKYGRAALYTAAC